MNLETICHGQLARGSFSKLRTLEVEKCQRLEAMIIDESEYNNEVVEFNQLRSLKLNDLPNLRSFCWKRKVATGTEARQKQLTACPLEEIVSEDELGAELSLFNRMRLEKLDLRLCDSVQEIYQLQGYNVKEVNVAAAFELRDLHIAGCHSLKHIWSKDPQGVFTLQNLKSVYVGWCNVLKNIFPASITQGLLKLEKLELGLCEEVEEIVAQEEGVSPKLEELTLEHKDLSAIQHGLLPFQCFSKLRVLNLLSLRDESRPFLILLLKRVSHLDKIYVSSSYLEELFSREGLVGEEEHAIARILTRVKNLELHSLDNLKCIWNQDSRVQPLLQCLQTLKVSDCGSLINVAPSSSSFLSLTTLEVNSCGRLKNLIMASTAKTMDQLSKMIIQDCKMMTEIVASDGDHNEDEIIFCKLKYLELSGLSSLTSFCTGNHVFNFPSLEIVIVQYCFRMKKFSGGFLITPKLRGIRLNKYADKQHWEGNLNSTMACQLTNMQMFPKLEELSLDSISFKMLLQSEFPTEFFSKLKVVELRFFPDKSCASLFRFLPKLPNLEELGVRDSPLEELFVLKGLGGDQKDTITPSRIRALKLNNLGDLINLAPSSATFQNLTTLKVGGEHRETMEEIVFTKLKTLKLKDLQSLTSFCLGSYTLKFPSLEQVTVVECPNLRIFNPGVLSTPKLQSVEAKWGKFHWERDLNATIEHSHEKAIGFEGISHVKLSNFPMLKENWNCQFPFKRLEDLKSLVVDECAFFSNAISSNLLKHARYTLKELAVERCDSVEEVFDLEGLNADEGHLGLTRNLNELRLIDLPRLRHVWNKDPQGFLSFKSLKLLQVHNCSNLANIFTLSMALGLVNLQHMERCSEMPILEKIDVVDCPKMELLASAFRYEQDSSVIVEGSEESVYNGNVDISMAAFFGGKVAIPSLEELKVEWKTMKDMWPEKFQSVFLSGLKGIELTCYPGGCELLPTDFFQNLINLEKLVLRDASFEAETFHEANIGEQVHPESCKVPMLKHLMEKDSQQVPASQYLETEAMDCGRLKILLPFTLSFENLTTLEVSNCQGLINLMTSITSRSLVQLRRMKVEKCEMMQEIVASETDDEEERFASVNYNIWSFMIYHASQAFALNAEEIGEASVHMQEVLDMEDEDQQRHANVLDVAGWDSRIFALVLERFPASSRIPWGGPVLVNQVQCSRLLY
ncbi:hypothetical protein GH714_020240 [Hevea brasiliensis]|uniref:Disease resistance protein At4g27190-like leucine-rich repeats domain-containing protein n=1 Tax=Hevea brasiliensis TaxID=3981 RepID=A0A6A6M216_HEVBR|nr:hypothetical protein GH714_020240 [Hevea brasiliensis]